MAMSVRYTNFGGELVAEDRGGVSSFYVPDNLGSTVALKNTSGTTTDSFTYWPYGEIRTRTGSTATPFTFVGNLGYYQVSTSRYYGRARDLRPDQARWQTVDPLWPDEMAYGYVGNEPLGSADPSGTQATVVIWPVGTVITVVCYGAWWLYTHPLPPITWPTFPQPIPRPRHKPFPPKPIAKPIPKPLDRPGYGDDDAKNRERCEAYCETLAFGKGGRNRSCCDNWCDDASNSVRKGLSLPPWTCRGKKPTMY
jgi:RHS repeat-associated protein